MKRTLLSFGLLGLLSAAVALAQPPAERGPGSAGPRPPSPIIEALDADHDGTISAEELKGAAAALAKLDKNGDGKLTEEEYRVPRGVRPDGGRGEGSPGPGGERGRRPESEGREGEGRERGPGERGPGDRGPGTGGPEERGPGDRGPGARGPGDRDPAGRGPAGGPRGGGEAADPERMLNHMMQFDADGDGKLNRDEMKKFVEEFIARHHERVGGGGQPPRGGRPADGGERPERPRRPE